MSTKVCQAGAGVPVWGGAQYHLILQQHSEEVRLTLPFLVGSTRWIASITACPGQFSTVKGSLSPTIATIASNAAARGGWSNRPLLALLEANTISDPVPLIRARSPLEHGRGFVTARRLVSNTGSNARVTPRTPGDGKSTTVVNVSRIVSGCSSCRARQLRKVTTKAAITMTATAKARRFPDPCRLANTAIVRSISRLDLHCCSRVSAELHIH